MFPDRVRMRVFVDGSVVTDMEWHISDQQGVARAILESAHMTAEARYHEIPWMVELENLDSAPPMGRFARWGTDTIGMDNPMPHEVFPGYVLHVDGFEPLVRMATAHLN